MKLFSILLLLLVTSTQLYCSEATLVTQRFDWNQIFLNKHKVVITNKYGNIHLKQSQNDNLVLHAVAQLDKDKKQKAQFSVIKKEGSTHISIKFPHVNLLNKERVDLAIIVPQSIDLELVLIDGDLIAKKIETPISVLSETGNITISTSHQVIAFSKHGNISLNLQKDSKKQNTQLKTHDGGITIKFSKTQPHFKIINGSEVVSNSPLLLRSKTLNARTKTYNSNKSPVKIDIQSDTGRIILIDKSNI